MNIRITTLIFTLVAVLGTGCQTTEKPNSEFVASVDFDDFQTFQLNRAVMSGFAFDSPARLALEGITGTVLAEEFSTRGFEPVNEGADFVVTPRWANRSTAASTSMSGMGNDNIGSEEEPFARHDSFVFSIEIADGESGEVFWRSELPRAEQLRVASVESATRAVTSTIRNFPDRVSKDPALKDIE